MRGETSPKSILVLVHNHFNPLPSCEGRPDAREIRIISGEFQSTPLMRGETYSDKTATDQPISFQSTPLMRGETAALCRLRMCRKDFNPLPSCEGRPSFAVSFISRADFNPLPSCEGRRMTRQHSKRLLIFQSTPLMRGETSAARVILVNDFYFNPLPSCEGRLFRLLSIPCHQQISIHSPHARGDVLSLYSKQTYLISIHSPHARGDVMLLLVGAVAHDFNPLPSCEGRHITSRIKIANRHIKHHTASEGRHISARSKLPNIHISIHSPHARGDQYIVSCKWYPFEISIHSPHARGDGSQADFKAQFDISIHSPHARGDLIMTAYLDGIKRFQSTPLMRGETKRFCSMLMVHWISIHSPHARGDSRKPGIMHMQKHFNPLPSCEGRQHKPPKILLDSRQSIQQKHHSSFF